jgi:hypothetical protein
MQLFKYSGEGGAEETLLAEVPIREMDRYTFEWSDTSTSGRLVITARSPVGEPDDAYQLVAEPEELGVLMAALSPEAVERVMSRFLGSARPEVVGSVVGSVVTHLARGRA